MVATGMSATLDGALDDYIQHLRVERGLSRHTVDAYARDLVRFRDWLNDAGETLDVVDETRVAGYLVTLSQAGLSARSQARALSAIRGLFRFLVQDSRQARDPTELLEGPKLMRKLPDVLNRDVYDGLSEEEQGWVDAAADDALSRAGGSFYDRAAARGLQIAEEAGVEIIELSDEERARWDAAYAEVLSEVRTQEYGAMSFGEIMDLMAGE